MHDYVRFATGPLRARGRAQPREAHAALHARGDRAGDPRPRRCELVREHQAAGDLVAIVTATNEFVTAPIAAGASASTS